MALLDLLPSITLTNIIWITIIYWAIWICYCRTLHPLARIPGPLWPAVSRTWLMYHVYLGDLEIAERKLHDEYGPLVRIAPNEVMSSDPAAIPTIYRTHNPLPKSDYYPAFYFPGISKHMDLFTDTDEVHHAKYRKVVSPAYTLSSVLRSEDAIDKCTNLFIQRMQEFATKKISVDFGLWLEMYGYDVIGYLLYGSEFGFLETGIDVGNYIASVDKALPLLTVSAVAPSYARAIVMTASLLIPGTLRAIKAVTALQDGARKIVNQRMQDSEEQTLKKTDMLSQLTKIIREKGNEIKFGPDEMVLESWIGLVAGADSVAIALRAVFYHLMKNPGSLAKVVNEIEKADADGLLSSPIQLNETMDKLPFQIHMGRVAPREGLHLSGFHIPCGYRAGINAGIVQHDETVFGSDAGTFKPERWLESTERSFALEKGMLLFGAGTRTCTGRNIATTELHKLVPEILRHFSLAMAHNRPWKTRNAGFLKQRDLIVNLTQR